MEIRDSIWITWERQRRSVELAGAFGVKLYVLLEASSDIRYRIVRYLVLSLRTLFLILRVKPKVVFAQNPSIILVSILCIFRKILGYKLIVDRHSNFKLDTINNREIKWRIFHLISKFSTKKADLTIVTNGALCDIVNSWGGSGFVLEDKLPNLELGRCIKLDGKKNIVFISTFSEDEPTLEIIEVGKLINSDWVIYITGNYKNYKKKESLSELPSNVRLTGFLPEKEYQSLLMSADFLLVFTNLEHLLTCGAYEGISLSKPLVLSDTVTIRNYFKRGAVYSKSDSKSISNAIKQGMENRDFLEREIVQLREELKTDWHCKFNKLCSTINKAIK